MTQQWSPIFNGNSRGSAHLRGQKQPPFKSISHQGPKSPPRLSAGRSVAADSAFNAIKSAETITPANPADDSLGCSKTRSCFTTPKRERSNRGVANHRSPTSVVGPLDHHHPSLQARGSPRGGSGVGDDASSPNRKYKTEMCNNLMKHGYCRFGENCHYAHSEAERYSPSVEDLMKDDRLLFPCSILVSTGFCPYGHRCKNLHDPKVALGDEESTVVVLEHFTRAKRHGGTIPDRLYHHQLNSIHQVNPLVAPYIWENCRPSRSTDKSFEWMDTYNLVCNAGLGDVNVFPKSAASSSTRKSKRGTGGGPRYSDVVNKNNPQVMLGELQKLCIVLQMRAMDDTHLDFTYASNECMNGQPCMVLHTRYFRLLDFTNLQQPTISTGDIVTEVPSEVYHAGKSISPSTFVSAHEVAFDSKGKPTCNHSIWFDTKITTCSTTKAKKISKKDNPWHLNDKSGSLFCMPNNEEFEKSFPITTPPYVFMQPVDDIQAGHGHDLVKVMLEHRVATILLTRGFCFHKLPNQFDQLGKDFARMKNDLKRWAWPKTSDMNHLSKTTEVRNQAEYSPSIPDGQEDTVSSIWKSFGTNLDAREGSFTAPKKRLDVFHSIMEKTESSFEAIPPRIELLFSKTSKPRKTFSHSEATWRELLLGEGENMPWKKVIESHVANSKRNAARPSSYGHFNSYSR